MLSGTFDLFSLTEVIGLVERAETSGALVVRGREVDATLYLVEGQFSGGEVADLSGPVDDLSALETRLLEVCVSVLRCHAAEFEFLVDVTPGWPAALVIPSASILERASEIARAWPSIMSAVESFESMLERTGSITTASVTLSAIGFRILELVDGHTTIRQLAQRAEASLVVAAPEVRSLILAGAVRVLVDPERALATARAGATEGPLNSHPAMVDVTDAPPAPMRDTSFGPVRVSAPVASSAPTVETMQPAADPVERARERADLASRAGITDPGPVPEAVAQPERDAPTPERAQIVVDRSDLLRMFSGLKDDS